MIKFIAELGSNHNGNLDRCYKLINAAKDIGADAVKFQLFDENLYAPQYIKQRERLRKWQLPLDYIPKIAEYCKEKDIKFGCSVFYFEAVEILKPYVDWYKIGSFELTYLDLIRAVAKTGKPVIMSTGMGTDEEIEKAVIALKGNDNIILLHCNSSYPANVKDCDLIKINYLDLRHVYLHNYPVGWSDHTRHPGIIYAAIAHKAEVIEFHMDLEDGKGWEYSVGHVWLPHEIQDVIDNIRIGEIATQPAENKNLDDLRKQRTNPKTGQRGNLT